MKSIEKIENQMECSPSNISFNDLKKVCEYYFEKPIIKGSHFVFKTPWQGDPRVNIQKDGGGKAKVYQVKQVLSAISRIKGSKK